MMLTEMLMKQLELQRESFGIDPLTLEGEKRIEFIRWNVLALENELHEFLQEIGWKPWATSRHVNQEEAIGELVDAWHFFMNLLLVTVQGPNPYAAAATLMSRYERKHDVNARRQEEGYDGVTGKCRTCGRDLAESTCTETVCRRALEVT